MDKSAASSAANGAPASQTQSHPTSVRESSSSSVRRADFSQSTRPSASASQATSASNSAAASPFASREVSPARPSARSHTAMKIATAAAAFVSAPGTATTSSTSQPSQPSQPSLASYAPQLSQKSQSPHPPGTPGTRSRRNSHQEPSPSRTSRSSIPTLATRPATLSTASTPTLLPSTPAADSSRNPVPQKPEQPRDSPRWPVSPRLRSPPPSLNRPDGAATAAAAAAPSHSTAASSASASAASTPTAEVPPPPTASVAPTAVPVINLQRVAVESAPTPSDSEAEEPPHPPSGMRTPMRGMLGNVPTLETVQEASPLGSPHAIDAALEKLETASIVSDAGMSTVSEVVEVSPVKTLRAKQIVHQYQAESGSESGGGGAISSGSKASRRGPTSAPAPSLTSRHSSISKASGGKGKTTEGSQPTMTVETETVTSIPNVAVGPASASGPNGSLRTKLSTETIRPKKEKKKSRKQAAVTPGTTSKADIFEAKVASAVDEANTSDSEETFVYDSNPADVRERPHRFHHSRTPSATSVANDRNGMRSIHSVLEGPGPSGVTMKKSMKFVNTFGNSSGNDSTLTGDEEIKGSAGRGTAPGSGRGTARLHHHVGAGGSHIGRWGLSGPKNGHQSIFDNESPFPVNSARLKLPHGGSNNSIGGRHSAGNTSPRATGSVGVRGGSAYTKRGLALGGVPMGGYDMDESTPGADDERTPLISPSMRGTTRNGRSHRHPMTLRSLEQQSYHHHPPASFLNRFASCLVLTVMLMLVISGAIGFMFATSQPLEDIELVKISGVIASEQELMFDLMVRAHNPNVVVVTVDAADMEVFAKSPHAGTDSEWWRRPHKGTFRTQEGGGGAAASGRDDASGTAPNDASNNTSLAALDNEPRDQPDSSPNFLLGKFTEFDNPLSFEGSFFHHGLSTSRSGVRIRRPGNGTDGGSERWERILDDEFDLIVKGVLRYSLPLSQRVRSALIEGRTTVKPNAADDPKKHPNDTATITVSQVDDAKTGNDNPPQGSSVPLFTAS